MAEWQKEWQNGRMAEMDTYVLFMVHADTDDDRLQPFNYHYSNFHLLFVSGFWILIPTHLYLTLRRLYSNPTSHHKQNTPKP